MGPEVISTSIVVDVETASAEQRQWNKAKQQPYFRHDFDEARRQQTCGENFNQRMCTLGNASQTADPAADAMSENKEDAEAEQEAASSTQSTAMGLKTMNNKLLTTASAVLNTFKRICLTAETTVCACCFNCL